MEHNNEDLETFLLNKLYKETLIVTALTHQYFRLFEALAQYFCVNIHSQLLTMEHDIQHLADEAQRWSLLLKVIFSTPIGEDNQVRILKYLFECAGCENG